MTTRVRSLIVAVPAALLACAALLLSVVVGESIYGLYVTAVLLMTVGALIVIRVPGNRVGIVLLAGGAAWLLYTTSGDYARLSLTSGPFPGEHIAAWIGTWVGALLPSSLAGLILLFPDGRLPKRWRWLGVALALLVIGTIIGALPLWGVPTNVLTDFDALDRHDAYRWVNLAFGFGFLAAVPAVLSLVSRYRKGTQIEHQQIKWLLAAAGLFASVFLIGILLGSDRSPVWQSLFPASVAGVPVAVAFAVFRYRLYEIDAIISRTVTYGIVVAVIGLVILGLVATMAIFLPSDDPLLVALATLVAFALFNPVRLRVQAVVDQHFNRARYDVARVVESFSGTLRDQTDADAVVDGWVGVVTKTMQPATVRVWVRE